MGRRKEWRCKGKRKVEESYTVEVGVRQGCVMSPWLFHIYMDGFIREMRVGVWNLGARLNVRGVEQPLVAGLYADDTLLLAENLWCGWTAINPFSPEDVLLRPGRQGLPTVLFAICHILETYI